MTVLGEKVDQNLQIETTNCHFYPCPSDTIKHSPENSKPGRF